VLSACAKLRPHRTRLRRFAELSMPDAAAQRVARTGQAYPPPLAANNIMRRGKTEANVDLQAIAVADNVFIGAVSNESHTRRFQLCHLLCARRD